MVYLMVYLKQSSRLPAPHIHLMVASNVTARVIAISAAAGHPHSLTDSPFTHLLTHRQSTLRAQQRIVFGKLLNDCPREDRVVERAWLIVLMLLYCYTLLFILLPERGRGLSSGPGLLY